MIACLLLSVLTGCKKDIELDYQDLTEPLLVVEGHVSNEGMEVRVTRSVNMDQSVSTQGIAVDQMVVTSDRGEQVELHYDADGYYRAPEGVCGEAGHSYTLSLRQGSLTATCTSTMLAPTQVQRFSYEWINIMGREFFQLSAVIDENPDEDNYYCWRMTRNGEAYRWNAVDDRGVADEEMNIDVICMTRQQSDDDKEEDQERVIHDGDVMAIEVQCIDRQTYDYLYALGLNTSSNSNPKSLFTVTGTEGGTVMGYFAAYSVARSKELTVKL